MALFHIFFWTCFGLVWTSAYYWICLVRERPKLDPKGNPFPWWVWATSLGVGVLGVVASGPGLFFDRPYWLIDRIFWFAEKLAW